MREKFNINGITIIIDATKIEYDSKKAHIHAVKEDDEFTFEAISCAARPVEFSIVNQLYKLDKELVKKTCDECNQNKTLGVLSTNNYYLILSPFVDRFTFFGEEQAEALTNGVIEICKDKNIIFTGGDGEFLSSFFKNSQYKKDLIFENMKRIIDANNSPS